MIPAAMPYGNQKKYPVPARPRQAPRNQGLARPARCAGQADADVMLTTVLKDRGG